MENEFMINEKQPHELLDLYIKSKGITGKWIADNLDVHVSYISKLRKGHFKLTNKMRSEINALLQTDF